MKYTEGHDAQSSPTRQVFAGLIREYDRAVRGLRDIRPTCREGNHWRKWTSSRPLQPLGNPKNSPPTHVGSRRRFQVRLTVRPYWSKVYDAASLLGRDSWFAHMLLRRDDVSPEFRRNTEVNQWIMPWLEYTDWCNILTRSTSSATNYVM
jgi:hypothetical protein